MPHHCINQRFLECRHRPPSLRFLYCLAAWPGKGNGARVSPDADAIELATVNQRVQRAVAVDGDALARQVTSPGFVESHNISLIFR